MSPFGLMPVQQVCTPRSVVSEGQAGERLAHALSDGIAGGSPSPVAAVDVRPRRHQLQHDADHRGLGLPPCHLRDAAGKSPVGGCRWSHAWCWRQASTQPSASRRDPQPQRRDFTAHITPCDSRCGLSPCWPASVSTAAGCLSHCAHWGLRRQRAPSAQQLADGSSMPSATTPLR